MKLSRSTLILFVGALFFCTSCIQIEEYVKFNRDGSGTFQMVIDMSQMKSMMDMMMSMSDEEAEMEDPFADLEDDFEDEKETLESIPGVSNARVVKDSDTYRIGIGFDFEDITALNAGMNKVFEDEEKNSRAVFFTKSRGVIERTEEFDAGEGVAEELASGEDTEELGLDPAAIFGDMNYTTIYEFEDEVKQMSNEHATLSDDGHRVTFKYYFFKEEYEGRSVANRIKF